MKYKLILRCFIGLILITLFNPLSIGWSESPAVQEKYETVYILTNELGKVIEERVVQWHRDPSGKPINNDLGIIDKALPFNLMIEYFYNNVAANPNQIIGKKGNLKTRVKIQNLTSAISNQKEIPFVTQLTFNLDLNQYRNIKAKDAYFIVTGNKLNLAFNSILLDSIQWEWEMDCDSIELESMLISFLPKLPAIPDFYGQSKVLSLMERLNQLKNRMPDITSISDSMIQSNLAIQKLKDGIDTLSISHQKLDTGFKEIHSNIKTSQASLSLFSRGIQMLKTDTDFFSDDLTTLSDDCQKIYSQQDKIKELAQSVKKKSPTGSEEYQLAELVLDQSSDLSDLSEECLDLTKSQLKIKSKTESLATSFGSQFQEGAKKLEDSLNLFEKSSQEFGNGLLAYQAGVNEFAGKSQIFENIPPLLKDLYELSEEGNREIQSEQGRLEDLSQSANTYSFFTQKDSMNESQVLFLVKTRSSQKEIEKNKTESLPVATKQTGLVKWITWIKNLLHIPSSVK